MADIHPFAYVSPRAELGSDVSVGPFSIIEPGVCIGEGCRIAGHVVIKEGVTLGPNNEVGEGTVLGGAPQHLRAGTKLGTVVIGSGNRLRESVTVHRGLAEHDVTRIGDHNLLMVNAHVGHDAHVGSNCIIANNVMLGGHSLVQDRAYLSGAVAVHQFCRIGTMTMVGGQAHVVQDVPPYVTVDGLTSRIVGLNTIGLKRNGFTTADLTQLKEAYRIIYRSGLKWVEVLERLRTEFPSGPAAAYFEFLSTGSRGFVQERRTPSGATVRLRIHEERRPQSEKVREAM